MATTAWHTTTTLYLNHKTIKHPPETGNMFFQQSTLRYKREVNESNHAFDLSAQYAMHSVHVYD